MPAAARRSTPTLSKLPDRGETKLAARIASQIADDVIARGWPVGEVLGSAAEYQERYDVSRAVFREAVRLLEHQQVVRTQRGATGGLIVTEPTLDAVIDAAVLYLLRVDARVDEVFEARVVLEQIVTELACRRIDAEGRARLEAHLALEASDERIDPHELHGLLASLTGNPALELLVHILNRVSSLYLRDPSAFDPTSADQVRRAHVRIVRAVVAGDGDLARADMHRHLTAEADRLRQRRATRQALSAAAGLEPPVGGKRAEAVAREIYGGVVAGRFEPGHYLGSEPMLLDRYGVSRSVFREAVRLLEHHQIATMRRGTGGGLIVTAPSPDAVTDVVALYLARRGTSLAALAELRGRVEAALVDLVIDRLDAAGAEALHAAADLDEGDEEAGVAIHNLHATMAALAGNRALELVALVLIRLTRFHQHRELSERERRDISAEVQKIHRGIAGAVQAGDRELARKRMGKHLAAVSDFLG